MSNNQDFGADFKPERFIQESALVKKKLKSSQHFFCGLGFLGKQFLEVFIDTLFAEMFLNIIYLN